MTLVTKHGKKVEIPHLFALGGGVWVYPLEGDETYTDENDGTVYTYDLYPEITEIVAIYSMDKALYRAFNLTSVQVSDGSFFHDRVNKLLYVHWWSSVDDTAIDRTDVFQYQLSTGYASKYNRKTRNIWNKTFFKPVIAEFQGAVRNLDPLKLGLIQTDKAILSYIDQAEQLLDTPAAEAVGTPIFAYYIEDDAPYINEADAVWCGRLIGFEHDREKIRFDVTPMRAYDLDAPCCPNTVTLDKYPNCGEDYAGKLLPVAWGVVTRGFMQLINAMELSDDAVGTAKFIITDPTFGEYSSCDAVYDIDGNPQIIVARFPEMGQVWVHKSADMSASDCADFAWSGFGYSIYGDAESDANGLRIIQHAYSKIRGIPYSEFTYDMEAWEDAVANNPERIGFSVQSSKSFSDEIIQRVCTSLQGYIDYSGTQKISFRARNLDASIVADISIRDMVKLPTKTLDVSDQVSQYDVRYKYHDTDDQKFLSYTQTDNKNYVRNTYFRDTSDPISPVETCLVDKESVEKLIAELDTTVVDPQERYAFNVARIVDVLPFHIIAFEAGTVFKPNKKYGEVLNFTPDYVKETCQIKVRMLSDYAPPIGLYIQGFMSERHMCGSSMSGATRRV